ncbi:hypothetical protein GF389_02240 [Candidatus Dojkabacteria bacterium]|nr:hypothetical protein [Candidatus Dojkabacteria bacterium]
MKTFAKVTISLLLIIIFLVTCFAGFVMFSFGSWLHTYKTFTQKELVAVVEVGALEVDEQGYEYTNVKYKPVKDHSALTKVFSSRNYDDNEYGQEKEYKMYGDYIEVGGQMVKFRDFWNLFNLKNIYKVTRLEGDYIDPTTAKELPAEKRSIEEINGGIDDYWKMFEENDDDFDFLVDSVYGNFSTKFVQQEERTYGLYVTEDGFILDKIED